MHAKTLVPSPSLCVAGCVRESVHAQKTKKTTKKSGKKTVRRWREGMGEGGHGVCNRVTTLACVS